MNPERQYPVKLNVTAHKQDSMSPDEPVNFAYPDSPELDRPCEPFDHLSDRRYRIVGVCCWVVLAAAFWTAVWWLCSLVGGE